MKKDEILIGRQVDNGNYLVDSNYKSVGRVHAKIIRKSDGVYIEDLDSTNGTYVNKMRVKLKKVSNADKISLGGVNYYQLDLKEVIRLLPLSDSEYTKGMMRLKQVYENYQTESNKLQIGGQESMMTKRMLPTMLLGVLTAVLTTFAGDSIQLKVIIGVTGAILSVLVFLIATKWASQSNKEMKDKLNQLNENFELDYVCPNCNTSFKGRSWKYLEQTGKCQACKRIFHSGK